MTPARLHNQRLPADVLPPSRLVRRRKAPLWSPYRRAVRALYSSRFVFERERALGKRCRVTRRINKLHDMSSDRKLPFISPLIRSGIVANDDLRPPAPYSFTYGSSDKYGSHGREESRDEHGTVRGSYRIALADGRMRVVKYVADKDGFRAGISTNEQGTESASSSGVVINSQALPGADAARAAHRSMTRAGGSRHSAPTRAAAAAASSNVEQWVPAPSRLRAPSYLPAEKGRGRLLRVITWGVYVIRAHS
ncbi:hypothetical protein MRX96_048112 [Rhipicephalus microplus]